MLGEHARVRHAGIEVLGAHVDGRGQVGGVERHVLGVGLEVDRGDGWIGFVFVGVEVEMGKFIESAS